MNLILAACVTEVFKLATRLVMQFVYDKVRIYIECVCFSSCSKPMQNYMVFNDVEGIYTFTFEYERKVYTTVHVLA